MRVPAFYEHAACNGIEVNTFFPEMNDRATIRHAKAICATCPVIDDCRSHAYTVATEVDLDGIWAGETKFERRVAMRALHLTIRRVGSSGPKRQRQHGTHTGYEQHRRFGEPVCDACREAVNRYQRERLERLRAEREGAA